MKTETLEKLIAMTDAAMAGDHESAKALEVVGEALVVVGGAHALCELQGRLHDYAVERFGFGSRGDAIGNFWEHIPEWAAL